MTTLREAAQRALFWIHYTRREYGHRCNRCDSEVDEGGKAVSSLRAALAQEQAEPSVCARNRRERMTLTPWYPGTINPIRPGIYQRMYRMGVGDGYAYWSGTRWYCGDHDIPGARLNFKLRMESSERHLPWRGLAEKPR